MLPLFFVSFLKVKAGINWWKKDGGRNMFVKYYNYSFVYYLVFIVEISLVMLTSIFTLNGKAFSIMGFLILACLPAWLLLHWHLKSIEE